MRGRNFRDDIWLHVFTNASPRDKAILVLAPLLAIPLIIWVVGKMPNEYSGKLGFREACSSVEAGASVQELLDHFPADSWRGGHCTEAMPCNVEVFDEVEYRYPCDDTSCDTFWRTEGWGCRVVLGPRSHCARGESWFQNSGGTWTQAAP